MTILWCGGEDIDFPIGISIGTHSTYLIDTNYAREGISTNSGLAISLPLSSPISSGWVKCYVPNYNYTGFTVFGIYNYSSSKGIFIRVGDQETKIKISVLSGGSYTDLAQSDTGALVSNGYVHISMHVVSIGSSAEINVYSSNYSNNASPVVSYAGDLSSYSLSDFDRIAISGYGYCQVSQIIVADEDTRLMRLKTLAPSAAGDTSANWTGAYTDIDETTISDADKIYSATDNADFQCNLTGMPSGTWSVKAVKIAARCVDGSGTTGIQLGVKSGGTVASGDTQTASGYWQTKERLMQVNPVTGVAFTTAEIEALQINLRAKTL